MPSRICLRRQPHLLPRPGIRFYTFPSTRRPRHYLQMQRLRQRGRDDICYRFWTHCAWRRRHGRLPSACTSSVSGAELDLPEARLQYAPIRHGRAVLRRGTAPARPGTKPGTAAVHFPMVTTIPFPGRDCQPQLASASISRAGPASIQVMGYQSQRPPCLRYAAGICAGTEIKLAGSLARIHGVVHLACRGAL